MDQTLRLAFIGAGISGLSCATSLQQAGLTVTLIDKSMGPAGRMSTRRSNGWQCDHGAQYFTAQHPDFRDEVARWQEDAHSAADSLLQAFSQLGAPAPDAWTVHRWRYASTDPQPSKGCAWDTEAAIGLCGDWINGGHVDGAWLSGRQLAGQVLHTFHKRLTECVSV